MNITKHDRSGVARLVECGWKDHDILRAAKNAASNRGESFTEEDELDIKKLIESNRTYRQGEEDATDDDLF